MKLQILSDLHQEFGVFDLTVENADLVIFAGDVNVGTKGIDWIKTVVKNVPVIYILGNHEYYKGSYPKTLNKIIELSKNSNVHVLENKSLTIDGITFHGATLWTNFELYGNPRIYGALCQERMNDYKLIRRDPSYSKLRSVDTYNIHRQTITWLENSLATSSATKNVVITHHAPHRLSIPVKYKDEYLSAAYVSDLENFIYKYQPDCWIHGHIHETRNYFIGKTNVICNPAGYPDEPYNGFNNQLIIEI